MLSIYIGYDRREPVAYHVLAHSILRRASVPLTIAPVRQELMQGLYTRPRGPTESTEFSLSRFLVPALSGFTGWSLFMDCDMLCRVDIAGLHAEAARQRDKAVLVCKHDYQPNPRNKFLDQAQTIYPRKNWSSVMLFNNDRCRALTTQYVNSASGLALHRFEWIDDALIGELPLEWNWLVEEYRHNQDARIVHYTRGGPWFPEFKDCDYADEWRDELKAMTYAG